MGKPWACVTRPFRHMLKSNLEIPQAMKFRHLGVAVRRFEETLNTYSEILDIDSSRAHLMIPYNR